MQTVFHKPLIQVLYSMGIHGLIARKKTCPWCMIHPMTLVSRTDVKSDYVWKCTHCFSCLQVTKSCPISNLSVRKFDRSLTLWVMNCRSLTAARIMSEKAHNFVATNTASYFHCSGEPTLTTFRLRSCHFYHCLE